MLVLTAGICSRIQKNVILDIVLVIVSITVYVVAPDSVPYVGAFGQYYVYFILGLIIHKHEFLLREYLPFPLAIVVATITLTSLL